MKLGGNAAGVVVDRAGRDIDGEVAAALILCCRGRGREVRGSCGVRRRRRDSTMLSCGGDERGREHG